MKICSLCLVEKSLDDFHTKNGKRVARCKNCINAVVRQHYKSNKAYYINKAKRYNTEYRATTKDYIRQKKNRPCQDCNQSFPYYVMDFDHVDGDKVGNIASMTHYCFETLKSEIDKCEVVCANCHRIRTHSRRIAST